VVSVVAIRPIILPEDQDARRTRDLIMILPSEDHPGSDLRFCAPLHWTQINVVLAGVLNPLATLQIFQI